MTIKNYVSFNFRIQSKFILLHIIFSTSRGPLFLLACFNGYHFTPFRILDPGK